MSGKYPALSRFVDIMVRELDANKEKGTWKDLDDEVLISEADIHLEQLNRLLDDLHEPGGATPETRREIAHECADVSNFMMFIADNAILPKIDEDAPYGTEEKEIEETA